MSEAAESAHVRIILADYAAADDTGKLNIVGGGISIVGINPQTQATPAISVVATVSFDPAFIGESPAVELQLEDEHGEIFVMPGDPPQKLRAGVSSEVKSSGVAGLTVPGNAVRPKSQIVMQFMNGLPLKPGHTYRWRVKVDHMTRDEWTESLYVPTVAIGPTLS